MKILTGTANTPTGTMRFMPASHPVETRQKEVQAKSITLRCGQSPRSPFRGAVKDPKDADWDRANLGWVEQRNQYGTYAS